MTPLSKMTTATLMAKLAEAGAEVLERKDALDEAKAARLALLVELDDRRVSYRQLAKTAGGITHAGVLKALQAYHGKLPKPIV